MADDGFNFRPVERRDAKRFEPPPWEQDRFDELARQRAEQEAREREDEEARLTAAATLAEAAEEEAADEVHARERAEEPESRGATAAEPPQPAAGALDDERVAAMLAGLAAEEPKAPELYWRTNLVVGGALLVSGAVFLVWGMAALVGARRAGAAGMLGGFVMLLFGAGFVFGGLYVVVRSLRQRGVL